MLKMTPKTVKPNTEVEVIEATHNFAGSTYKKLEFFWMEEPGMEDFAYLKVGVQLILIGVYKYQGSQRAKFYIKGEATQILYAYWSDFKIFTKLVA